MAIDAAAFRAIFGASPGAVTVVTTLDGGEPAGLTTSALCEVSKDPPLLLVCLDERSRTLPRIRRAGAFAVNFLGAGRDWLAERFAGRRTDKFADICWVPSAVARGAPLLTGDVSAYAECLVRQDLRLGDHTVFVGLIEGGVVTGRAPLLYRGGTYRTWHDLPDPVAAASGPPHPTSRELE